MAEKGKKKAEEEKKRINIVVSQKVYSRMLEVQKRLNATTLTEAIRRSMDAIGKIKEREAAGGKIVVEDNEGNQEFFIE